MEREMLEHNLRLLDKRLREKGFSEEALAPMREKLREGKDFSILVPYVAAIDGETVKGEYTITREGVDVPYRFAGFSMELGAGSQAPLPYMLFQSSTEREVTLLEGYNLMHGRALYRERGAPDSGRYWVTLDREQVVGETMYNYERTAKRAEEMVSEAGLSRFLGPEQLGELAESLRRGDRREVTINVVGVPRQVWVELGPERERLKVTDYKGRQVNFPELNRRLERDEEEQSLERGRGRRR